MEKSPIFILGIAPRSGTNFLCQLLMLHPDVVRPKPIWEDYFLSESNLLLNYTHSVFSHWDPNWGNIYDLEDQLIRHIVNGIYSFLESRNLGERLLMKTPSVKNLNNFEKLFPEAYLLIIVRDGRDVVESGVRTFGWKYEDAIRKWTDSAKTIQNFAKLSLETNLKYKIVRYEDLVTDLDKSLQLVLNFLNLDITNYSFQAARELPVIGSCDLSEGGGVHWRGVKKRQEFNPIKRWENWNKFRLRRFNHLAGQCMIQFGYIEGINQKRNLIKAICNKLMDYVWNMIKFLKRAFPSH